MPIKVNQLKEGRIIEVTVSGKLNDADYQYFVPEFDRLAARHSMVRLLFEMSQFHGWEVKAAWDDFKLGLKHHDQMERIAMVGEKKWQEWMAKFCQPFTAAKVRYFDQTEGLAARAWLEEGLV
jgi:hypothetical protein